MTAMSATSAQPTPSTANAERTVLLPGSPATYANRAALCEMGLRWDPARHQWHGTTTPDRVCILREQLGLDVRCFGMLDQPPRGPSPPSPSVAVLAPAVPSVRYSAPRPRFGDYSRTRFESRVAFGGPDEGENAEEVAAPTRRFSLLEITSGLPDDSREEDERTAEGRLREVRARVKMARAVVATTPGLAETLAANWQKAAHFYAKFGITEERFQQGVPGSPLNREFIPIGNVIHPGRPSGGFLCSRV
ncbi:MAG: hypothetical protein ACLPWO_07915 [Thermoplasmata archaeon]